MVVAKAAGGFLGGIFNNPGIVIIAALAITLFIFRDKISEAFANFDPFKNLTNPFENFEITNPFEDFEFPTFENPFADFEFPDFGSFFDDFFGQFGGGNGEDPPFTDEPTEEEEELPGGPGIGPVTFPPGCFINSQGILDCPTPPTFDACAENPDLPQCQPEEPGASIIGGGPTDPVCVEVPMITGGTFNTCTGVITPPSGDPGFIGPPAPPIEPPFMPPVILPPGFTGGGPSFEGGTIFERDPCFMSLNEIINAGLASSASEAADLKARACSANITVEPTDFPTDFDFGFNTGSGFGPGDDPTGPIITGGATPASEAQRAACVSCELFGLNCPICSGTI